MRRTVFIKTLRMFFFSSLFTIFSVSGSAYATIELMTDDELTKVDAQISEMQLVNHNTTNDTVRIFLDIHNEIYGTVDSVRVGYYYKESSQLATTPIQIGLSGFEGYYHGIDTVNNGANFQFFKILSDFNTMAPSNGATLKPWGNGSFDSQRPEITATKNINNFDWDLWVDQIQLGESPDKPQYMNGLIIRMEFDSDLTVNKSPKLQRLIIGTNDQQGNMYYNPHRITAAMNGLLLSNSTNRSAGAMDPYKSTAATVMVQRDPLVQCFGPTIQNVEDRDTGLFLIIDFMDDHLGFSLVVGSPENAIDFNYTLTDGQVGYQGIDLFDPGWAPYGNSGMSGSDPYDTARQEDYVPGG